MVKDGATTIVPLFLQSIYLLDVRVRVCESV